MINLMGTSPQWGFNMGFRSEVDFCIWILEEDGLQVSPFNHHADGTLSIQRAGMTAIAWQQWLTRVVLVRDARLNGDPEARKQFNSRYEHLSSDFLASVLPEDFDRSLIPDDHTLNQLQNRAWSQMESQYQEAIRAAAEVGDESEVLSLKKSHNPIDCWNGSSLVREHLETLRLRYESVRSFRQANADQLGSSLDSVQEMWDEVNSCGVCSEDLVSVYLVSYPRPVELIIHPASIVLSVSENLNDNFAQVRSNLIESIKQLVIRKNA